jgi:hypothetical protein
MQAFHGRAVELLLDVDAWNAASLLIAERELNGWQLRRLVFDDGEWVCSLSRQPQLPLELDDTADAHHDIAACAILHAIEVRSSAGDDGSCLRSSRSCAAS